MSLSMSPPEDRDPSEPSSDEKLIHELADMAQSLGEKVVKLEQENAQLRKLIKLIAEDDAAVSR